MDRPRRRSHLCIIPAKARSTRLPGKNIAQLAGKPLVVWSIDQAIESRVFDTVMVSTDDQEIARVCRQAGAEVPFLREASLAGDLVEVPAVVLDAVRWYRDQQNTQFEWVCTLQPTSPLRTARDIVDSLQLLTEHPHADGVTSVSRYHHHPYWALQVDAGYVVPCKPESATASRQDLPELFHPDGTVTWQKAADILQGKGVYAGRVLAYITPASSVLDIDHPQDLEYARWRIEKQP